MSQMKNAFANAKAENVTMDEFVPDEKRTNRTQCPPHFPPLSEFTWTVDRQRSVQCPTHSDVAFTCPRPQTNGAMGVQQGPLVSFFVLVVGLVITLKFLSGLSSKRTRSASYCEDTDVEVTSEESRIIKLPKHEYSSLDDSTSDSF